MSGRAKCGSVFYPKQPLMSPFLATADRGHPERGVEKSFGHCNAFLGSTTPFFPLDCSQFWTYMKIKIQELNKKPALLSRSSPFSPPFFSLVCMGAATGYFFPSDVRPLLCRGWHGGDFIRRCIAGPPVSTQHFGTLHIWSTAPLSLCPITEVMSQSWWQWWSWRGLGRRSLPPGFSYAELFPKCAQVAWWDCSETVGRTA